MRAPGDEPLWPPRQPFPLLRWHWRRWRAAHYVQRAAENHYHHPCDWTAEALQRTEEYLSRVNAARP